MKSKKICHRVVRYGPGGWTCPCCGPSPRNRRKASQQERRVFARLIDTIEKREALNAE